MFVFCVLTPFNGVSSHTVLPSFLFDNNIAALSRPFQTCLAGRLTVHNSIGFSLTIVQRWPLGEVMYCTCYLLL
jgi:hypothetical protein